MNQSRLVIVTGLSGAGKTQAVRSLEDLGFFCVDNLPPALIPKFGELLAQTAGRISNVALVVDIRGGEFFDTLFEVLADLDHGGVRYEILFLDASDEALVRRFKETRRRHPLSTEVLTGIREERRRLEELKGRAHKIIDTSDLTSRQLKDELAGVFGSDPDTAGLQVTVVSFGFKYGVPLDSDLVMDVRFLPNPHYVAELKLFTGNDAPVAEYVFASPVTGEFMKRFLALIEFVIPFYAKEGKTTLMIAIGCTGGMHRSVALANRLGEIFKERGFRVRVRHRDVHRV
ncbi:MAG: RNase adapter RapZ [Peptococcaceae bacterium]|nr:RNase adapter RapZ [Peptococcaceae bacterium]